MSIALGPLRISLGKERTAPAAPSIGPEELQALNAPALDYIRALPRAEIDARLARVTLDGLDSEDRFREAEALLAENGIVIIANFLDESLLDAATSRTDGILAEIDAALPGGGTETERMLVQTTAPRLTSYAAMAEHVKPVVSVRQGQDQGMIDIFNVDGLMPELRDDLRAAFQRPWLLKLMESAGEGLHPENLNLYLNRGITKTRGFHVDSYKQSLKGFIYLRDVDRLGDGPYCYVTRSHRPGLWRDVNKRISEGAPSKTETPFIDAKEVLPVLGKRGTLVLSDQAGMHRGIPQAEDGARQVLVMRYK